MMEESQFSGYSAGHLSASYDSSPQNSFINAAVPYRACPPLTTTPIFNPNITYNTAYDPNQPVINIHPDDMIGSNTDEPPELMMVGSSVSCRVFAVSSRASRTCARRGGGPAPSGRPQRECGAAGAHQPTRQSWPVGSRLRDRRVGGMVAGLPSPRTAPPAASPAASGQSRRRPTPCRELF